MLDPTLNQQTLDYLEQFGLANLPDKEMPSAIREMLVSNDAYSAARVKDSEGNWQVVLLSGREISVAHDVGMSVQHYAELKSQK